MTPQECLDLLRIYGIDARVAKDEVKVKTCFFCLNTRFNLELNPGRGVYKCWACGSKGALGPVLKKHVHFQGHIPVIPFSPSPQHAGTGSAPLIKTKELSDVAVEYLKKRGIGTVDSLIYEISEGVEQIWSERVVFTLREYWSRDNVGAIGRGYYPWILPKYYAVWRDDRKCITGFRTAGVPVHVVVEGAFDGITIHRAGFNAAVLGGVEGPTIESWACRVPTDDTIIILLDGDAEVKRNQLHWRLYPLHQRILKIDLPTFLDPAQLDPSTLRKLINSIIRTDL